MSLVNFVFKPKKKMASRNTKWVKVGKYTITSHAQNRTVQKDKDLGKVDMLRNLFGNSENSRIYTDKDGTRQYDRLNTNNRTLTFITADHHVKTIRKYHKKMNQKKLENLKVGGNIMADKNTSIRRTTLSDESVQFIKDTILPALGITAILGTKEISDIEDWINDMIDGKYDESGKNIILSRSAALKIEKAEKLLGELLSVWDNKNDEYLNDLNAKLGF